MTRTGPAATARTWLDEGIGLRGDQVKALVRGIESGMKHEAKEVYRPDMVPMGKEGAGTAT